MTRISDAFAKLKEKGQAALVPFLTAGDPDIDTTYALVCEMVRRGADMIELGVPFSDPMADGPVLQRAAERALENGTSLPQIFDLVAHLRRTVDIPIVLFGYYNPVWRYGIRRFVEDAKSAEIDGVLCVDLPLEEAGEFKTETDRLDLDLIFLLAPTTPMERVRAVLSEARGFVYYVAVSGVTGARQSMPDDLSRMVSRIRSISSVPVGVGFGISKREHAKQVGSIADAAIVGSAVSIIIEELCGKANLVEEVGEFIGQLKLGLATPTGGVVDAFDRNRRKREVF